MGVSLIDLGDKTHTLYANWWTWRPTIELMRRLQLLDDQRLEMMVYNATGVEVTAEEAHRIARTVHTDVLPHLTGDDRVYLDGSVTAEPDDGTLYTDARVRWKNYSVHHDWLQTFTHFCLRSQGFEVL